MEIFHPSSIKQNRDGTGNNRLIFPAISTFTIKITDVSMNEDSTVKYLARITTKDSSYNSYANLDLTESVARSLHDSDMQQGQAVKDACNELTGVTDWVLDPANNQISYTGLDTSDPSLGYPTSKYIYQTMGHIDTRAITALQSCSLEMQKSQNYSNRYNEQITYSNPRVTEVELILSCLFDATYNGSTSALSNQLERLANPFYDPAAEQEQKSISLETVAAQVISNAESSNESISLLAEAYIEAVANSIFSTDVAKQFVKLADLISQFKINKV